MRRGRRIAVTALGLLLVPGAALAQFAPVEEEAGPGITITGAGFAHVAAPSRLSDLSIQDAIDAAQPIAVTHAVGDARERAEAIARAAGARLGPVDQVELQDAFPQFRQSQSHCRRSRRTRRLRCRVPPLTAAAATVTFSIAGGAQGSEDARKVKAYGAASIPVEPKNPRGNASIRRAFLAARLAVIPEATAAARRNVETAARSAGLTLGGIVSISEQAEPYFYDAALGSFGPGQYCRVIRLPITRRDPQTGRRRVVRRVRRRRCFFPRTLRLRFEATYEAR
jgi:uncharacterized protein YggE